MNGVENGLFKEYDEYGNLEAEYSMSNGELNGVFKLLPNGKLKISGNYLKGRSTVILLNMMNMEPKKQNM